MLEGIPTRISLAIWPTDAVYLYQMELLGTFLGTIVFGVIAVLIINTAQALLGDACIYPKPMRRYLLCYTVFMFVVSLFACVQQIAFVIRRATSELSIDAAPLAARPQLHQTFALPFAIWGADAFLIWRCKLVYKEVSRIWTVLLFILVVIVATCSLGSGTIFFLNEHFASTKLYNFPTIFIVSSSGLINVTLRSLIVGRIVYHRQYTQRVMGMHYASIYTRIISMCVETCFMTSLCGAAFFGLYFSSNNRRVLASVVPLILLPHICCITPIILLFRAAKGRCVTELAVSGPLSSSEISHSDQGEVMEFKRGFDMRSMSSFSDMHSSGTRRSILTETETGYMSSDILSHSAHTDHAHA